MTTYNTRNPLGSAAAKDLYDNSENMDHLSLDLQNRTWPDRLGRERKTWHGIEEDANEAILNIGFNFRGSFQEGATLLEANDIIQDTSNFAWYRWDNVDSLPKIVPPGSTPDSTGGIAQGAWQPVDVSDVLRRQLQDGSNQIVAWNDTTVSEMLSTAYPNYSSKYDLFVIYGQSNAVGYADNAAGFPSVNADAVWFDYTDGQIKPVIRGLKYSSGDVSTGHAWASFANEYIKLTGRKILFVPCAKGGTALSGLKKGTATYTAMISAVTGAISAAATAGYQLGFKSILFHQGETDMSDGTVKQTYQSDLDQMISDMRSDMSLDKCFLFRVGCPQNRTEMSWYAMQTAQDYLCQSYDWIVMAFADFGRFTLGNGLLRDGVHATQNGYNFMGLEGAKKVVDALIKTNPATPDEMKLVGNMVMPQDQIWRYTYARMVKLAGVWTLIDKTNTSYTYRNSNVLSIQVFDSRIRVFLQSRANWILGLDGQVNQIGAQYGIKCTPSLTIVDATNQIYALDLFFTVDAAFAVAMNGTLYSAPDMSTTVSSLITANITTTTASGVVTITHPGSKRWPLVQSFANTDFSGSTGITSIGTINETSFSVKNSGGYRAMITIPGMTVRPASLPDDLQVSVSAILCERKD
jgi:hypothetical protein